jgi:geranylgeranyl pyrophosphate synthase
MAAETIAAARRLIEGALSSLAARRFHGEQRLVQAIDYALRGKGKRVRPILTLLSCHAVCGRLEPGLAAAMAIELIHTYSLVHDDLPAMDNDDLRRGRPTLHVAFDEALALLAGDALLTEAFHLIAEDQPEAPESAKLAAPARLAMVATLASAAGSHGMVYGQALDMMWTGRGGAVLSDLDEVHRLKTGRLLAASSVVGALAGGATPAIVGSFERFGAAIGLAFQVRDDILDDTGDTGKTQGKDLAQGKLTYLSLMSRAEAKGRVEELTREGLGALLPLGEKADALRLLVRELIERDS